jgi:hypothetical protein
MLTDVGRLPKRQKTGLKTKARPVATMSGLNTQQGIVAQMEPDIDAFNRMCGSSSVWSTNDASTMCQAVVFKDLYVNDTMKGDIRLKMKVYN